jgi:hypothetical protein
VYEAKRIVFDEEDGGDRLRAQKRKGGKELVAAASQVLNSVIADFLFLYY